ncbi:MAG: YncE family protein, partial [Proteobacteria bacterium]|nr:YncE family protein [Pseudomonadota bacterium]
MNKKSAIIALSMVLVVHLGSTFTFAEAADECLYVGNWGPGCHISVVDIESNAIIKNISNVNRAGKLFVSPDGVQTYARSYGHALVIDNVDQIVVKPMLEHMKKVQTIAISPDSSLAFVGAYNPYQAWTGGQPRFGGGLFTFDTSNFEKLRAYDFGGHRIRAISVRNDGKYIYADCHYSYSSYIRIYDVENNLKLCDLSVKFDTRRFLGMAQSPDGRYLYAAGMTHDNQRNNWNDYGYIQTIDTKTNQIVHTLKVRYSQFYKIAVSPNGLYACVIDDHYKKLYIINLQDYSYRSVSIGEAILDYSGNYTESIIFSPDSSYVYVLKMESYGVMVIDLNNAVEVNNIALDNKPCQMIMTPDGRYIYVTIPNSHKVSVIDVATDTIVKNITGFSFPSSIVYVSIKNDPPVTVASVSPSPNEGGWNNTNITINLTATDNEGGSGIKELHYELSGVVNEERTISDSTIEIPIYDEGLTTLSYYAIDNSGNAEEPKSLEINIDKTPPLIVSHVLPQPNSNGWNNTDVTVNFTATDALSGVVNVSDPVNVTTEGENQLIGGEVTDAAGNRASTFVALNIDKTSPVISSQSSPQPNVSGWNNTDVTVAFVASDALSGIDTVSDLAVVTAEGEGQQINGETIDLAGNRAAASLTLNIDKTPPVASITTAPEILWPPNHKLVDVTINGSAGDILSGVGSKTFEIIDEYGKVEPIIADFNTVVQLEASRKGKDKDGRNYTISVIVQDQAGNE